MRKVGKETVLILSHSVRQRMSFVCPLSRWGWAWSG